jgi:uncharacterized membrane protein YfcA
MPEIESWMIYATLAFLAAGTVKGTLGIGLPIAAVGLMTLFIDARLAVSLMVFPIMFTNIWQMYRAGDVAGTVRKYWLFAVVLMVSMIVTTSYTAQLSTGLLVGAVGVVIILFSLMNLAFKPPPLPDKYERVGQVTGGVISGIMGGLTAIWSPAVAAYLIARAADKDEFIRTTGFLFFIGSLPLCVGFWQNGMLTGPIAMVSAGMIIPTVAGFSIGEVLRRMLKPERFKILVLVFFLLIGFNLVRRAFMG